jgi:hypothetical protein
MFTHGANRTPARGYVPGRSDARTSEAETPLGQWSEIFLERERTWHVLRGP